MVTLFVLTFAMLGNTSMQLDVCVLICLSSFWFSWQVKVRAPHDEGDRSKYRDGKKKHHGGKKSENIQIKVWRTYNIAVFVQDVTKENNFSSPWSPSIEGPISSR